MVRRPGRCRAVGGGGRCGSLGWWASSVWGEAVGAGGREAAGGRGHGRPPSGWPVQVNLGGGWLMEGQGGRDGDWAGAVGGVGVPAPEFPR
jgi:hypothetical protein